MGSHPKSVRGTGCYQCCSSYLFFLFLFCAVHLNPPNLILCWCVKEYFVTKTTWTVPMERTFVSMVFATRTTGGRKEVGICGVINISSRRMMTNFSQVQILIH